ncbi:autotransporter assembly complex family protein [Salinispirillum marinum]|uniref:Autotransporter assembly complex family protein n=2 Tax=Saccharospirillaceae TaxID=255527 RepID=A0ABV8BCE2_9GAMM
MLPKDHERAVIVTPKLEHWLSATARFCLNVVGLWVVLCASLWAQVPTDTRRFDTTNEQTLLFTSSVNTEVATRLRAALDAYRAEQQNNTLVTIRPLAQQSTEQSILRDHLRAMGYYSHTITPRPLDEYEELRYEIRTGALFRLRTVTWDWPTGVPSPLAAESLVRSGQPVHAQTILDAQAQLQREIQQSTCFLRVNVRYQLALDYSTHTGDLRFYMDPSQEVTIRSLRVDGLETVERSWAARLSQLTPGQCFQRPALDQARLNMYQSNLFAQINEVVSEPDDGEVDVIFSVQERFHRTIKLGAGYDTDAGIGLSGEWAHRNFAGRGENLILSSQWSLLSQAASATYIIPRRQPYYPRFTFSTRVERTEFDTLPTVVWQNGVSLEQILSRDWTGTLGADLRSTWLTTDNDTVYEQWFALPASVVRDTRDDVLDARRGSHFILSAEPNWSLSISQPNYARLTTGFRGYESPWPFLTLALYAEAASLVGLGEPLDFAQLNESERLYAGGGGSVRGWPYQEAGVSGGGRLRLLNSLEQRWRVLDNWGVTLFLDSAWLSSDTTVDWDDRVSGAGIGLRYFTAFAPIRFDVAWPVPKWQNNRSFYISIGQAF